MSIIVKNLTYIYDEGMPFASKAIDDISFEIKDRDFVGLIGHTGSGKSTLIQHLNGLIKPSSGEIFINEFNITGENQNLTEIRKRVGIVFQYPEYQLFEETVEKDIAFGPSNLNLSQEEISIRVKESMRAVGLDYDEYKDKSPFDLSGGQKRRVAIAGVIAMNPELLILDEPTAGLDPGGRDEIFALIKRLHEESNMTIILSSHSMDDMAKIAKTIIVMNHGKIEFMGTPRQIFNNHASRLKEIGLDVPQVLELAIKLKDKGFDIKTDVLTIEEIKRRNTKLYERKKEMLKDITIGQYYPANSCIHKLDSTTKLIATIVFMVSLFVINKFWPYLLVTAALVAVIKMSQIPLKYIIKGIKPLRWIILFTFVINIFFLPGEVIWKFGFLTLTKEGIRQAIFMSIRLVFLVVGTSLLTLTTSPIQLTDGIERMLNPLKKIGMPVHELAMMMTIALRFIPTLLDETDKIMKAQMSRGADFESSNIINRAKNLVPLLVPLFVSAFRRADELAMAMEARCYRGGYNRTKMKEAKITKADYIAYVLQVVFLAIIIVTKFI